MHFMMAHGERGNEYCFSLNSTYYAKSFRFNWSRWKQETAVTNLLQHQKLIVILWHWILTQPLRNYVFCPRHPTITTLGLLKKISKRGM